MAAVVLGTEAIGSVGPWNLTIPANTRGIAIVGGNSNSTANLALSLGGVALPQVFFDNGSWGIRIWYSADITGRSSDVLSGSNGIGDTRYIVYVGGSTQLEVHETDAVSWTSSGTTYRTHSAPDLGNLVAVMGARTHGGTVTNAPEMTSLAEFGQNARGYRVGTQEASLAVGANNSSTTFFGCIVSVSFNDPTSEIEVDPFEFELDLSELTFSGYNDALIGIDPFEVELDLGVGARLEPTHHRTLPLVGGPRTPDRLWPPPEGLSHPRLGWGDHGIEWQEDQNDGGGTGSLWFAQSDAPSAENEGDLWLDTDDGEVYYWDGDSWDAAGINLTGPQGEAGTNGTNGTNGENGAPGADGATWYSDSGAPDGGLGVDGDHYLDLDTGDVYTRSGTWSVVGNIMGPEGEKGDKGDDGDDGDDGDPGEDGATWLVGSGAPDDGDGVDDDLYLRTSNGDVYRKVAGSWGSPLANITGPTGATGATGANGTNGEDGEDGAPGADGATWFAQSSSPTANQAGDLWLDTDDGEVYVWDGDSWDSIANITGPEGPPGSVEAHDHDEDYAAVGHDHDGDYEPLGAVNDHLTDTSAAHAASSISIADAGNDFTATDVEGALAELQADHESDATDLSNHLSDSSDAHDASAISVLDSAGHFAATDVEAALAEAYDDFEAHDHDGDYAADDHDHDGDYAADDHDHDGDYAADDHDHDGDYEADGAVSSHAGDADAHHDQAHALVGSDHTASGLTTNHVLKATGATTFGFGTLPEHNSTHVAGGGDAIKLDDLAAPDDNTDLNATTVQHGLLPKLGGGTTNFLRADGSWAAPPGGSLADHDHSASTTQGGATLSPERVAVSKTLSLSSDTTVNLTGNVNDWSPTGLADMFVVRIVPDAAWTITGIAAPSDGRVLVLYNFGPHRVTIAHSSASSSTGNKIKCPGGEDFYLEANSAVILYYTTGDAGGIWYALSDLSLSRHMADSDAHHTWPIPAPIVRVYTPSGSPHTWTKPAGLHHVTVEVVGGGGGAGSAPDTGSSEASGGAGGGGGGYAKKTLSAADLASASSATVTVGGGGAGGAGSGQNAGTAGTNSTFAATGITTVQGNGGGGGASMAAASTNNTGLGSSVGGAASGGDLNIPGVGGGGLRRVNYGGGANLAPTNSGGASALAGGEAPSQGANDGRVGIYPGGGGSGTTLAQNSSGGQAGGAGADGVIIVTEYYG